MICSADNETLFYADAVARPVGIESVSEEALREGMLTAASAKFVQINSVVEMDITYAEV